MGVCLLSIIFRTHVLSKFESIVYNDGVFEDTYAYNCNICSTMVQQRAAALADFSPDGGLPEHVHHIDRRGMGGRSQNSLAGLRTMGVSAQLHARIHTEGDHVLDELPQRHTLEDLW